MFETTPKTSWCEFRKRFYDTEKFFDPFAGGKFAQYLFVAHEKAAIPYSSETAHHLVEEAQLFIEASHSCYNRMGPQVTSVVKAVGKLI